MVKFTKNHQKIIIFLGGYPERRFFSKEIAGKLGISLGGAHNALKYLLKEKIVEAEQKGNMWFYQINDENPLVKQLKTAAAIGKLLPLIDKIKNVCEEIILFGSASRGEQTITSDIDLFILAHNPEEVKNDISRYQKKIAVKAVIKTPNQWGEMEVREPEFYKEVKRGIRLF